MVARRVWLLKKSQLYGSIIIYNNTMILLVNLRPMAGFRPFISLISTKSWPSPRKYRKMTSISPRSAPRIYTWRTVPSLLELYVVILVRSVVLWCACKWCVNMKKSHELLTDSIHSRDPLYLEFLFFILVFWRFTGYEPIRSRGEIWL